jgi:hypothetical protein
VNDFLGNILGLIVMLAMGCLFSLLVTRCERIEETRKMDRNTKCFEQTQDKHCWGMAP